MTSKDWCLSSTIESFSFLDIRLEDKRKVLQEYMKPDADVRDGFTISADTDNERGVLNFMSF